MSYKDVYENWKKDPEAFWMAIANSIDWYKKPTLALNSENAPLYEWFTDARVNTCFNAVDRHLLNGRANQKAIIYDSPVTDTKYSITYSELHEKVSTLAGALLAKGISKGDRVIIYMPVSYTHLTLPTILLV